MNILKVKVLLAFVRVNLIEMHLLKLTTTQKVQIDKAYSPKYVVIGDEYNRIGYIYIVQVCQFCHGSGKSLYAYLRMKYTANMRKNRQNRMINYFCYIPIGRKMFKMANDQK